ncbi:MAG TPA: cysteine desulfurase-like protein [Candidatus Nanopelagicaceae bacterium]|nr:cysteine desulfurase-like protein [Candidatus Nanopelagicaceae bacterium]
MHYDVQRIRKHFPSLDTDLAFFDGPAGSQVPDVVGEAMKEAIIAATSNRGTVTESERNADRHVKEFREAVSDLINCDPQGVVYGRSWTQLAYDFSRNLSKTWKSGDEIIVSRLDHDSNIRPWIQAAESVGAMVKWAEFDRETGDLPVSAIETLLSERTRLVAVTGASNTLGTRPDLVGIQNAVHASKALLYVDGVHLTPHAPIDVKEIGADFYGFSAYKLMGPHCAALAASPSLLESIPNDKLLPSTSAVPERFEFGTLPYEIMAGVTAAINFIAGLAPADSVSRRESIVTSMMALEEYETDLFEYMEESLAQIQGLRTFGHAKLRTPTVYFDLPGIDSADVYRHLATKKVNAPAGHFYALEISRALGLGDAGAIRAGLAPYNNKEDVDRLVAALKDLT